MTYGSTHQTYGTKVCARCSLAHDAGHHIRETHSSRFKLMRLLVELVLSPRLAPPGTPAAAVNADRMFGVLVTPERTFATHSGELLGGTTPFLLLAAARGMTIALTQEEKANGKHTARVGTIRQDQYQSAKVAGAYKPGNCAAPRLIEAALEDPTVTTRDPSTWSMSEVMFNPSGSNQQWWHGLTAYSCATCEKLVPMLLCPTG
jgi:hypothetical protein